MAPKKKAGKKGGNDDWEAELGESIAPAAASPTGDVPAAEEEPSAGGGGLMNLMRKNKEKRKKKGLSEDWLDGENPEAESAEAPTTLPDLSAKQAEEANLDDEFALPDKKGKGGKGKQQQQKAAPAAAAAKDEDDEGETGGRVLTKAEKEKLKKEREKQRKKEQVGLPIFLSNRLSKLTSI
jgi:translation initiation factor 5B